MRSLAWLAPLPLALALAGCGDHEDKPPTGGTGADMAMPGGSGGAGGSGGGGGATGGSGGAPDDMAMGSAAGCPYEATSDGTAHLLGIYTLPPTSLQTVLPYLTAQQLADALTNGALTTNQISLGSGLDYGGGCPGIFYGIGDRGINGKVKADKNGVSFPLAAYTPMIAQVSAHADGSITIERSVDLYADASTPATGLSNTSVDEVPYASPDSTTPLPLNPNGLDPEDVRRLPNGDFLICEEYGPSVALVDGTKGTIKVRYVPASKPLTTAYPTKAILPAVFANRRANKGFEGLAVSPDGHTAWVFLQAPMGDTKDANYANSLVNRILRIDHVDDPASAAPGAEYVVVHAPLSDFPQETSQASVYFNSATYLDTNKLLVIERASGRLTLVVIDLSQATDILGQSYESTLGPETLDAAGGLTTLKITPATKQLVFDSNDIPALIASPPNGAVSPSKLEGVAIINPTTVAIANDNDFGISNAKDDSRIWVIRLKQPLK